MPRNITSMVIGLFVFVTLLAWWGLNMPPYIVHRDPAAVSVYAPYDSTARETGDVSSGEVLDAVTAPIDVADVYEGVNQQRRAAGVAALTISPQLEVAACAKADDMITRDYWDHVAPDGTDPWHFIQRTGYQYEKAGENLAYGQRTAVATVDSWMDSPSHRENMLSDFTQMGICVKNNVSYQGGVHNLIVNHFATPK